MRTLAAPRDRADLIRRVRTLGPGSVRRWGRMSAPQMVCHLCDSFRMVTGQKPVSGAASLLQRTLVKWIALYLPLPWPKGVPTRPEIDQENGGTRPADFAADIAALEAMITLFTTEISALDRRTHPIFGRMSRSDWLRWAYLHTDHHLRQFGA